MLRKTAWMLVCFAFGPACTQEEIALADDTVAPDASFEGLEMVEGELEIAVQTDFENGSRLRPRLRTAEGDLNVTWLDTVPHGLQSASLAALWGHRQGDDFLTLRAASLGEVAGASNCTQTGEQRAAVLLVSVTNAPSPAVTSNEVAALMFSNTPPSLSTYWAETSYGQTTVQGDVFGWYSVANNCDIWAIRSAALSAADADVTLSNYTRIFLVVNGCSYAGVGTLGCNSVTTNDGTFAASTSWLNDDYFNTTNTGVKDGAFLAAHEGGHNLTLGHSSSRDFGAAVVGLPGQTGVLDEYGDWFSSMGSWNYGHYTAPHKARLGWIVDGATYKTIDPPAPQEGSSHEIPLVSLAGSTSGFRAIKARRGAQGSSWFWLEYRKRQGYDALIRNEASSGLIIHYEDATTGDHSHLLDFTPQTASWIDSALAFGSTWTDALTGMTITASAPSGDTTNVTITYPDATGPSGTITINNGNQATKVSTVNLAISANDGGGVTQMCISATTSCVAWEAYSTTRSFTLPTGSGSKTVRVWFADQAGNIATASDSIILDTTLPTGGSATASYGDGQATLSWSGFTDTHTGVVAYKIVVAPKTAPATCAAGTLAGTTSATSLTLTGLTNGMLYAYRICAIDGAGNISAGAVISVTPRPESDPPSGSIVIADGAVFTKTVAVVVALPASDLSAVAQVCLSNTVACTSWLPYAASRTWNLSAGTGVKTVYAKFKDTWGNESASTSDTITLDSTVPGNATLSITSADSQNALTWTAASDLHSGVAGYKLLVSTSATPVASCASGTVVATTAERSVVHSGLSNGTTYYYRLCTIDAVGNVSVGVTATARPAPEYDPPTGGLTIAAGEAFTKSRTASVSLNAIDASGVASMCISSSATCTTWIPYATTATTTLSSGSGIKTVYARFRDIYGNISSATSDSIVLDETSPSAVTLSAIGGNGAVTLSWSAASDVHSGVARYRVVFLTTASPAATCSTGTVVSDASNSSFVHAGLSNGVNHYYRVCAIDAVGNVAPGTTVSARPAPEFVPPTGTVIIASGSNYAATALAPVTISAQDESGVSHMCIGFSTTCSAWVPYATSATVTLPGSSGAKTVFVTFRDVFGNQSQPVSDSIVLDTAKPTNSTVTAVAQTASVSLTWSTANDVNSGVAGYKVTYSTQAPASCNVGVQGYAGMATNASVTGLSSGTLLYFRICAIDNAGNVGTGTIVSATPL